MPGQGVEMRRAVVRIVLTGLLLISLQTAFASPHTARATALPSNVPSNAAIEDVCQFVASIPAQLRRNYFLTAGVIDVNNDGVFELVAETSMQGTMGGMDFDILAPGGRAMTFEPVGFEWKDYWTFGGGWLPYKGKVYYARFKAEDFRFLSYLAFVAPDEREHVICTFDNVITETVLAFASDPAGSAFCSRILQEGRANYIGLMPLEQRRKQRYYETRERQETHPNGYASVDFNNDGQTELLIYLEYASGADRGCDVHYFDVMSADGLPVNQGDEHDTLIKLQGIDLSSRHPGACGGNIVSLIAENGTTYFHLKYRGKRPGSVRQMVNDVYAINGTEISQICNSLFRQTTAVKDILPHQQQ
jgi:hypothetical protein